MRDTIIGRLANAIWPIQAQWARYRAGGDYHSDGPDVHGVFLSEQVARIAAQGQWDLLSEFFESLEHCYASRGERASARLMTDGLLQDLIEDLELLDVDLRRCFSRLGTRSRAAWCEAYRDGHGGAEWPGSPIV